ncbi:MAG: protein kinase, partial [Vicinamibacteria bacterium]|nr:protein kinase [Vicinamibacteria bacterium]
MALAAGSNLGPYRIIESVGRGGMASVFKAYEASLDRYVALKVLPPEFLHDPTFAERFRREAQTVARLEHPQIIPIFAYDIDAPTGTPWMAMRLISGGSLSQRIKRGRLAHSECARILVDVADALDYAHGAGVIHRDVKPQNVLLDDAGRVYLADFGIAKMVESTAHMTQTGMITGTPQYMAPEQALGKKIDKSIDIYALGIVAYELFTGRVPFSADTPVAVLMKQASEPMPLPPVSVVREEVTRAILRATAKDSAARWPTASTFAQAVSTAANAGANAATSSSGEETVQGIAAPLTQVVAATTGSRTAAGRTRVEATPSSADRQPSGMGLAATVLIGIALLATAAAFVGYRFLESVKDPAAGASAAANGPLSRSAEPAMTPVTSAAVTAAEAAPPEAPPGSVVAPFGPRPDPPADGGEPPGFGRERPDPGREPPFPGRDPLDPGAGREPMGADRRPMTPAERRAVIGREVMERRGERLGPSPQDGRRLEGQRPEDRRGPGDGRFLPPPQGPSRTRIVLEVEASQPSTGDQISALFAEVLIDGRPYRAFPIRFSGANSFARWK